VAMLPCTACGHRQPLRNAGIYAHLWNGGVQEDFRLRLCPGHLTTFEDDLAKYEVMTPAYTASVVDSPSDCLTCRKPVAQTDWHFSATAYPAKDQRKDYWARLHTDCRLPAWGQNGQPLL
jgi:hypothetical protein